MFSIPQFKYTIMAGDMPGFIDIMAEQSYYGGYPWDTTTIIPSTPPLIVPVPVSDYDAEYTAKMLLPMIIRMSGGLFDNFCSQVGCDRLFGPPPPNNTQQHTTPDDNFDVSSRLIQLEELDVTKQGWKDLYGRTGIKKGYNGLFLEKIVSAAYTKLTSFKTESEYQQNAQQFSIVLDRAQKEAKQSFEDTYYASADVALFSDAFVDNAAEFLLKRLKEPIREVKENFTPSALLTNQPILFIPSGAISDYENSPLLKASLDEYVKNGGTLIVLAQKYGKDFAIIPTPDGKPITSYGWEEDINCFSDSLYIDTWHQMLSGQSRPTPTVNVDGYFNNIPSNSIVLLRRSANGQPSLIMYEHGQGRVIAATMYTDWAYGHGQASGEEIALVRDMLTWAKKPVQLPEFKAGEQVNLTMIVTNTTATDAAQIKAIVLTPDRSQTIYEQIYNQPVAAGQSGSVGIFAVTGPSWQPGIYHVDYLLLDASGNIIQPQAETDSGRFALTNPPAELLKVPAFNFAVNSDSEHYAKGSDATFTLTMSNHTDTERTITAKYFFPHHYWESGGNSQYGGDWSHKDINLTRTLTISPKGSASFIHTQNVWASIDRLWAYFYDENGKEVGMGSHGFYVFQPAVDVSVKTTKSTYAKGETVAITCNLQNRQNAQTPVKLRIKASDPSNAAIYINVLDITLPPNCATLQNMSFVLPAAAQGGFYTISAESFDSADNKIGGDSASFELPLSLISVTPTLPSALVAGSNTVSFKLNNVGKLDVSTGTLDVTLADPDGAMVASLSRPFVLPMGQNTNLDIPLTIPALRFGTYTLTFRQNDETRSGKPAIIKLDNSPTIQADFDKSSYRMRETANVTATLTNSGRFILNNVAMTVSVADAGYTDTRTVTIAQGQSLPLTYAISIPNSIKAGQHLLRITLALPGGATLVKEFPLTVPESNLNATVPFSSLAAGGAANVSISNSGGVDTQVQYNLTIVDAQGIQIIQKSLTETVSAGGALTIPITVPTGAVEGNYLLVLNCRDMLSGAANIVNLPITLQGVAANLTVKTERQAYLATDSINALANVANGLASVSAGNLHLQVTTTAGSQVQKSWTTQFDFQQGTRSGVDTFETPDSVTLLPFSDNFNDGIFNADRWGISLAPNAQQPSEQSGVLQLNYPWSTGGWSGTTAYMLSPLNGDFDASVDYNIVSPWQSWSDNHPAGMLVSLTNWNARIDVWGSSPTYGSIDSWNSWTNVGGASLQGKFRIRRVGSTYYMYYWNGSGWNNMFNYYSRPTGPAYLQMLDFGPTGNTNVQYDNFIVSSQKYAQAGTLNLKYDSGRSEVWDKLNFTAETPVGTSVTFRTRTAETEAGLASALWSTVITSDNAPITSLKGRWIEIQANLATTDINVTPKLYDLLVTQGRKPADIIWQTDLPVTTAANDSIDLSAAAGNIATPGKYYLQGILTSSTGQTVARAEAHFFVAGGDMVITLTTDKRIYRPGETVTISGQIRNTAAADAVGLALSLNLSGTSQSALLNDTYTIPAGGSLPFSVTTTAGSEGSYALSALLSQSATQLASLADTFDVAMPVITASITAPDVAGDTPFNVSLELKNSGKVDATFTITPSITLLPETIAIPAGRSVVRSYQQQIAAATIYSFAINGDLNQTLSKQVAYGIAGSVAVAPQVVYPEGTVSIPVTITNTGLLDGRYSMAYELSSNNVVTGSQTREYVIPKGISSAGSVSFTLEQGNYQLAARGTPPGMGATAAFQVRKTNQVALVQESGVQATSEILPVTVRLTNNGSNQVDGVLRLALTAADGSIFWNSAQDVSLPTAVSPAAVAIPFSVNLAAARPGDYTLKAELSGDDNHTLAQQPLAYTVRGAIFALPQVPPYQTFQAGGSGTFSFKIKNNGNREGACTLSLKAADLTDASRTEWLKPGEEKEVAFTVTLPADLEEKDYTAAYRLTGNGITVAEDVLRYGVTGIKLSATASLDRQQYRPGESATLSLTISQPTGTAPQELFARVHYNEFDGKQDFLLSGSQTLIFTVPLSQITSEKLFYGIYHQSGRSIHLNTIYVYPANDLLAVATDKQVYNPGEAVTATITGSATGNLMLNAPGDFSDTLVLDGTASRSIPLPADMTAGTYKITATVTTATGEKVTAEHPIDVAGLKVTIKEARLDKAVYAATDIMKLTITAESNRDLPATLRSWVVDPTGTYTPAGESAISLIATSPSLITLNSSLFTGAMGIHKLVYGIYRGNELIVSGAKAFDIGNALVTAVATDKKEYPAVSELVTVNTELFGTTTADLAIQLDGTTIQTTSIALSGFGTQAAILPAASITPGRHMIKALLTSAGLTSTSETEFIYGSNLPDLTARLTVQSPKGQEVLLTATVANQGKSSAGPSRLTFFDGDPLSGGTVIAVLSVPVLDAGATATVTYNWNILGKAGEHLIHAVADSSNTVVEFDKRNNSAWSPITLPSFVFSITTGKTAYAANEEVALSVSLANLSTTNAYPNATVELKLTDPAGTVKNLVVKALPLQLAYATNFITSWNTGSNMPGGYTLRGRLLSGTTELAAQDAGFAIQPTVAMSGSFITSKDEVILDSPLSIATMLLNNGNVDVTSGEVLAEIVDKATGTAVQSLYQPFERLLVQERATPTVLLSKIDVQPGDYLLRVTVLTAGLRFSLGDQPLKVLPPLEVIHGIDLSPRVLVLVGREGNNPQSASEADLVERQIRQALNGYGTSFSVVYDADAFRRELRSGMYNTYILAGSRPLVDHLESELGERVNAGDGLILFGYDKLEDVKLRDLSGLKAEGRLPAGVRSMTLLPSPMTHAGTDQVEGTPLKLRLLSTTAQVAATVAEKGNIWPMIVLNPYGAGKVVVLASELSGDLLGSALSYVTPVQGDSIPGAPLHATIILKSLGAPFDLQVTETVPASLPILSTRPLGTIDQYLISWFVNVPKDGTVALAYTIALPESGGRYEANTEVAFARNGSFETYKSISHILGAERSLADIRNDILGRLRNMLVTSKDANELREALRRYETFLAMPDYSAPQLDKAIGRLLEVVEELREIAIDMTAVRLDLDRLLKAYGRKWTEAVK